MAGTSGNQQFNSHSFLDEQQQNLLLAALSSNMNGNKLQQNSFSSSTPDLSSLNNQQFSNGIDPSFFASPQQHSGALSTFDTFNVDESPYLDFVDGDPNFDFGDVDGGDDMIGPLPDGDSPDLHDKRKSPEDDDDDDTPTENDPKRQEGEDKVAKKPGRKPLTSEPTSVSLALPQWSIFTCSQDIETQGPESGSTTCIQRAKGEASQGPRDQGRRAGEGLGSREAREWAAPRSSRKAAD
ncbi:MAG: hypothetical protein INR71_00955 [Terriglobus roseus]|nr:hypothetical protein [Terriglobus roseus]